MSADSGGGLSFPKGFLWGGATASYQIEGAVHEDGRGESIWDRFSHTPGKVKNGDTGDVAIDHYHRWKGDIAIMRELGISAYRLSTAWPRIVPNGRGQVNQKGLDFYDRLTDGLLDAGIQPWVTLYHWDLPQVLEDEGGWRNRETVEAFGAYTDALTRRIGDRVNHWITINEPWVAGFLGHLLGIHAPGLRDMKAATAASHNLLRAHGRGMEIVRANVDDAKTGITLNLAPVYPYGDSEADADAQRRMDGQLNRWFLDPVFRGHYPEDILRELGPMGPEIEDGDMESISAKQDFLGINYYSPMFVAHDASSATGFMIKDMEGEKMATGWLVDPESLQRLLVRVHDEYQPAAMYITENGAAYDDPAPENDRVADPARRRCIHDHLIAARKSIDEDVPLKGYFVWSLFDNFEWSEGYDIRFGITYVDYATQARTIKDSGRWYAEVTRANAVLPIPD
jgi:beta-glucosidase